jgi:hypothetical protein
MTPKEGSLATDHTWSRPSNLRHTLHIGIPDMVQVGQKQPARLGHSGGCTPDMRLRAPDGGRGRVPDVHKRGKDLQTCRSEGT